jgi:hypothetical protein
MAIAQQAHKLQKNCARNIKHLYSWQRFNGPKDMKWDSNLLMKRDVGFKPFSRSEGNVGL